MSFLGQYSANIIGGQDILLDQQAKAEKNYMGLQEISMNRMAMQQQQQQIKDMQQAQAQVKDIQSKADMIPMQKEQALRSLSMNYMSDPAVQKSLTAQADAIKADRDEQTEYRNEQINSNIVPAQNGDQNSLATLQKLTGVQSKDPKVITEAAKTMSIGWKAKQDLDTSKAKADSEIVKNKAALALDQQKLIDAKKMQNGTAPQTLDDMTKTAGRFGLSKDAFGKAVDYYNQNGVLPPNVRSLKALPLATAIMNGAALKYPDSNMVVNKADMAANAAALKNTSVREAAVERIVAPVKELQAKIITLTEKLNAKYGSQWVNEKLNDLTSKYGNDPDLAELSNLVFAVGREYVTATTMPGSNAQMHISSDENAEKMMNRNMPPAMLSGALKGINEDIEASRKGLSDERKRLLGQAADIGKNKNASETSSDKAEIPAGWSVKEH
jgi:hypothetical protein